MIKRMLYMLLIGLGIVLADYCSKLYLIQLMVLEGGYFEVTSFMNLVMVWNQGVSFGMFQLPQSWGPFFWVGLSSTLVLILFIWGVRSSNRFFQTTIALIIGGALGNMVDRVKYGAVADFFDFHAFGYHWPAFNIADIAIFCGACLIIVDQLFFSSTTSSKSQS